MNSTIDLIGPIIANAQAANPPEEGDYYDDEGFLVCGKCHTRRECIVKTPVIDRQGEFRELKVRALCECRAKAKEAEEERLRQEKEMKVVNALKGKSLMDEQAAAAVFSNFRETKDNARNLRLCRRYAEHFDEMAEKNQGLLLWGDVGTGKTFAAACIANYLLERRTPVVMTSCVKLLASMQGFREDEDKLITQLNRAKLLIIDDLGAERGTDFALEKVYNIVDSRYRAKKPVILTTNLTLKEMKEATDIRYSRIYDRIFEVCYPMQFTGVSWRKVEAARRFDEMKNLLEGF